MWKLSTNHSAAGVIARSSRMALAIARYASRSTRPLSSTRGNSRRPFSNSLMTGWAAARLSACCSRRSTPKSSARIGSSNGCGANSAEGWAPGIAVSEAKESGELLARTRDCSGSAKARQPLPRREIEYTGTRSLEEPCLALKPARSSELLDQLRPLRASDDLARAHPVDIAEARAGRHRHGLGRPDQVALSSSVIGVAACGAGSLYCTVRLEYMATDWA